MSSPSNSSRPGPLLRGTRGLVVSLGLVVVAGCSTALDVDPTVASGGPVVAVELSTATPAPSAAPTTAETDTDPQPDEPAPTPTPADGEPTPAAEVTPTVEAGETPAPDPSPSGGGDAAPGDDTDDGEPDPTATPAPEPTPTPSPTAGPTSTPTPTPLPTPEAIEFVVGPNAALLGVPIGADADAALAALRAAIGEPDFDTDWYEGCPLDGDDLDERLVQWGDLNVYFDRADGPELMVAWGYDLRIVDGGFPEIDRIELPGGARLGDPIDDVAASIELEVVYDELLDLNRLGEAGYEILSDAPANAPVWGVFVPAVPVCS